MKVGSMSPVSYLILADTKCRYRAEIQARTCAVATQDRKSVSGEAAQSEKASEEGTSPARRWQTATDEIEPRMAIQNEEGPGHPQPFPL
jgi:hypothetical protein